MEKHYRITKDQLSVVTVLALTVGGTIVAATAVLVPHFINLFATPDPVDWLAVVMTAVAIALTGAVAAYGGVCLKRLHARVAAEEVFDEA